MIYFEFNDCELITVHNVSALRCVFNILHKLDIVHATVHPIAWKPLINYAEATGENRKYQVRYLRNE